MLFWEMIAVCSQIHIKYKTSLREHNEELMHFKIRLTHSKQRALRVQGIHKKGTLDRHCQPTLAVYVRQLRYSRTEDKYQRYNV